MGANLAKLGVKKHYYKHLLLYHHEKYNEYWYSNYYYKLNHLFSYLYMVYVY